MTRSSVHALFAELNRAGVRYLVAGGLAVNVHGYLRFTKDVDLVVDLEAGNVRRAFAALERLGYVPALPVSAEQFADSAVRETWVRERNMQVLQLWSDAHRETPVDVFVAAPFPFDAEYARAKRMQLPEAGEVRFVSLATLREMKRKANRIQDRIDLDQLEAASDE